MKTKEMLSKNKPIRVLQFAATDETLWFLLPLIKALKAENFEVMAAARKSGLGPDPETHNFEFFDLPITRRLNLFAIVRAIFAATKLLRRQSIDILQVHTFAGGIIGRLAGWLARTPIVIYTGHGWLYTPETPPFKKKIIILTERIFSRITDHFFVISREEFDMGLRDKILREGNSTITLGVGVDCDQFDQSQVSSELRQKLRKEFSFSPQTPVIVFVGRLVEEKGLIELGQAFGRLYKENPNIRLLIIGSADLSGRDLKCLDRFKSQIKSSGCSDAVIFAGRRNDVRDVLAICDIFVLPTYREGMPVSLLEAMSMGLACVATDIPGCREEIVDGQSGYLIPARQAEPLYNKLKIFLQDPQSAQRMGQAARKRVIELFSLKKVLKVQLASFNRFRDTLNQSRKLK
jgi:glycosyltransferase involved in cell wall biosynthesis